MERLLKHAKRSFSKISLAALSLNVLLGSAVSLPAFTPAALAIAPTCTTTLNAGDNIQTAINAATAGDVICLNPGVYTPATAISINKSITITRTGCDMNTITTRSAGNAAVEAIVDGNSATNIFSIGNNVNNVTISCLEVTDGAGDLITSTDTGTVRTGIVVKNNIVHDSNGPGDEGIQLKRTNGAVIQYNDVYDVTGDGINISGNGTVNGQILDNKVHNIGSTDGAIYVYQSANTTIHGNLLYNVSTNDAIKMGIKTGAEKTGSIGGTISNNVIVTGSQDAISVYMSDVSVSGNKIKNSTSSNGAIYVAYASNTIDITDNLVTDNSTTGIKIGGAGIPTNVTVNDNCIEGNNAGVVFTGTTPNLNAENNWWGAATGANGVGSDTASANVDFTPFRTTGCHLEPIIDGNLDGIPDGADDPLSDTDSDGVPDASDNCPVNANASQTDSNSDGFGDACSSSTTRVVTASALQNWVLTPSDASVNATFVNGPDTAPLQDGSIALTTGADGDQYMIVHNGDFADTDLADITAMSYSTYVTDNQDSQAVYVSLRIDNNDDGIEDDRLYFEPVYQNGTYSTFPGATVPDQCAVAACVELNTWQTWNLRDGGWWSLTKNAGGPPLVTFDSYIAEFPHARIINGSNGGIRLVAGAGAPSWNNFDGNVDAFTIQTAGDEIIYDFEPTPVVPSTVRVSIAKYLNGVHATTGNTDNASFNMTAVYNASNIGSGSDPYVISATGNGTPEAYEAKTIALASGADYSTYETISAPCTDATPFELVGYSTGDSLAAAEAAPVSMTVPAFTGLTSDKFVIVWNETCPPVPTHLTPADGSTLTTAQLDKIDWSDVATPALPMTYFYEVATTDTSTNPDGSFVNPVYESAALSDSEIVTAGTGDGTYHWHVRAVDAAGNSSAWSAPWTVTVSNAAVDTTPPVVEILGYRNQTSGTYDSGPAIQACGTTTASSFIAFEWQEVGTDVSQPLSYEYKILSGPAGVGYTQVHSDTHHNGGIPAEGTYTIQITPTDAASNVGTPVTCTMTYDADYVAPVACNVSDMDLIAHWKLDEAASATVAEDATANNNDGAVMGATSAATPATTPVFINTGSYDFDGVNDSIDMGSNVGNFTVADSFSISAWINPALDFQNHAIYGNTWSSPGYLLRVTDQNKIRFILAENGSVYEGMDSGVLTPGWHHVTGVWDGANVKVYVDGVDASMTSIANGTVSTITTSAHTFIGQTGQIGSAHYFDGMIDDVRVYGDVLSESEIAALAAGQCQGGTPTPASSSSSSSVAASSEPASSEGQSSSAQTSSAPEIVACTTTALAGYWPMNEGEGTTAFDMTGLGHDGTLQGGTAWASGANAITPNPFGLDFDGSDDIVNITSSNDFNYGTQEFTVSTFVRTTTGNRSILGNFSAGFKGWGLYVYNTNQVNFFGYGSMGNNDAAKPALVLDGNWHNLTGVYRRSGNDLTIDTYVDGVLVGSNTAAVGDISANSTLYFGQYLPQPSLDGGLDDVRIYGRALSAGEVAAIAGGCSNPVIASSSSSSSSSASEGESSSESVESFQSFGLSTPEVEPGNGAFRGSRTNILAGVINFIKGKINITAPGSFGGVAPGGFGGASDLPYTIEEKNLICTMKRAIPTDAKLAIWEWVASTLSEQINHSADDILESLKDSTFCDYQATAKTKVAAAAKPLPFLVSAAGFPLSNNPTWNACVTGKVTLQDIRNNPDKDKHGRGLSCATYHTGNMWTHPDLKIFFTWNSKTKKITLPEGFAIEKQEVTL